MNSDTTMILEQINEMRAETRTVLKELSAVRKETKTELDEMRAETKTALDEMRAETKAEFNAMRAESKAEFNAMREETKAEFNAMRKETNARFDGVDARFERLEDEVHDIHLILENEIRRDIKLVAEGHLDLARNIRELQERESKNDKLAIDVLWLKGQVEKVNQRIDSIA